MIVEVGFKRNATGLAGFRNVRSFRHYYSLFWSVLSTLIDFVYLILVEHSTTVLLICHMPRLLKMEAFGPVWVTLGNTSNFSPIS